MILNNINIDFLEKNIEFLVIACEGSWSDGEIYFGFNILRVF